MLCSVCSSFAPSSSEVPGEPWTLLILFPAPPPCGRPVATLAVKIKVKKMHADFNWSSLIILISSSHVFKTMLLRTKSISCGPYLKICGLPFKPLIAEVSAVFSTHFKEISRCLDR